MQRGRDWKLISLNTQEIKHEDLISSQLWYKDALVKDGWIVGQLETGEWFSFVDVDLKSIDMTKEIRHIGEDVPELIGHYAVEGERLEIGAVTGSDYFFVGDDIRFSSVQIFGYLVKKKHGLPVRSWAMFNIPKCEISADAFGGITIVAEGNGKRSLASFLCEKESWRMYARALTGG
jgi:hypothetical protein